MAEAVDLGSESFENPNGTAEGLYGKPLSGEFFLDGSSDNFTLRDISLDSTPVGFGGPNLVPLTGLDGDWAIVCEDVNDAGNPLGTQSIIRLEDKTVTGHNNLQVTVRLGTHVAWNSSWENNKSIRIEYAFDTNSGGISGGVASLSSTGYSVAGAFYGNNTSHGIAPPPVVFSDGPALDGNKNGQFDAGENTLIPSDGSMADFTFDIPGTGNLLSVQVVVDNTAGSEELAIDYIRITGDIAASDPPVLANIEGTATNFTEGGAAVQVSNTITVADPILP